MRALPHEYAIPAAIALVVAALVIFWHLAYRLSLAADVRRWNSSTPTPSAAPPPDMKRVWTKLKSNFGFGGIGARVFTLIKRTFMPYRTVSALLYGIKGPVVDVGCGEGLLIHMLSLQYPGVPMTGIDINPARLEKGRRAAQAGGLPLTFVHSGAQDYDFSGAGTVMSTEAMHHMPLEIQDGVLRNIAIGLQPGGRLLLFEIDKAPTASWLMCEIVDWFLYRERSHFRTRAQWVSALQALGLTVRLHPVFTSFGILIIFLAEKPE